MATRVQLTADAGAPFRGHTIVVEDASSDTCLTLVALALRLEGNDPTIGIMHETNNGAAAFIFDVMEPHRATVDRQVLEFVRETVFSPTDFVIRSDGVCRLNPEMARLFSIRIGAGVFNGQRAIVM